MSQDPTEAALLLAVLERPDDDAPRLVLADWWEEFGGEGERLRAEFVRVQLRMAADPTLAAREAEILSTASQPGGFNAVFPGWVGEWFWDRGFVREVRLRLADFTEANARAMFSAHPVTKVVLTDRTPEPNGDDRPGWLNWDRLRQDNPALVTLGCTERAAYLPDHLWRLLPSPEFRNDYWAHYRPADLAVPALNTACVTWARSLVGLPPLHAPACPPPAPG